MKHKLFKTHLLASFSKLPSVDSCLIAKNDFKAVVLQSSGTSKQWYFKAQIPAVISY